MVGTIRASRRRTRTAGFTLVELMLGAAVLTVVAVALLGSYFGQTFLNTNARNLTAAMNDATRVMERIRQQNTGTSGPCLSTGIPSILPPNNLPSWDAWLNTQGKSIASGANALELVAVTCQDENGGTAATDYCGDTAGSGNNPPAQVGRGEWAPLLLGKGRGARTSFNPIRVTVAVGWQQYQRVMGQEVGGRSEFTIRQGAMTVSDTNGDGVIGSQAMVTTLVTCR